VLNIHNISCLLLASCKVGTCGNGPAADVSLHTSHFSLPAKKSITRSITPITHQKATKPCVPRASPPKHQQQICLLINEIYGMSEQLRYCTSLQFFDRCNKASGSDEKGSHHGYFRSRAEESLKKCLGLEENAVFFCCGNTSDDVVTGVLESILQEIDWQDLFANHNQQEVDHGNPRTALVEVLFAILDVSSKSTHRDCVAVVVFQLWSYHREQSNDVVVWTNADKLMFHFLGINYVQGFSPSNHPAANMSWIELINKCTTRVSRDIVPAFSIVQLFSRKEDEDDSLA
jgi:hypothetical protein